MRPEAHVKEIYSQAYVSILVARAGHTIGFHNPPGDYGIDATIKQIEYNELSKKHMAMSTQLDIQCKTTSVNYIKSDSKIHFPLEVKNYNQMAERNRAGELPILLFLLYLLGKNPVLINDQGMSFKGIMYWYRLKKDICDISKNKQKQIIIIPTEQILTTKTIDELLTKNRKGEL